LIKIQTFTSDAPDHCVLHEFLCKEKFFFFKKLFNKSKTSDDELHNYLTNLAQREQKQKKLMSGSFAIPKGPKVYMNN